MSSDELTAVHLVADLNRRCIKLAAWLEWCLDNCDDSAEWNFGADNERKMRALLNGEDVPIPPA